MTETPDLHRRNLLLRLGLAATTAYTAPILLALNPARASDSFSASSAPSAPSGPSSSSSTPANRPAPARQAAPARVPELLVAAERREDFARLEAEGFALLGAREIALTGLWIARFRLPPGLGLDAARARAAQLLPLARIEENAIYRTSEMLCRNEECGAFSLVGWPQPEPCLASPVIGMIDTGINPDHDAFSGQNLEVLSLDPDERRASGLTHGTAVAALIIGRAGSRTPGLLPNARLVAVDAFHADGQGDAADAFGLIAGLDLLAARNVSVINLSLAGPPSALLADAVDALVGLGIAVVAAAGNAGPRADPLYPAAYRGVLAVTAVDANGRVYRQASAGEHLAFAAPGVNLWTAASVSGGRLRSGTSYAAPFVTAALATIRANAPDIPLPDAIGRLARDARDLGDAGFDPIYGWGLVQAEEICIVPA